MQLGDLLLQRHPRNEPLGPLTRCQGRVLPSGCGVRQGLSPRIEPGPDPRDSLGECECECERGTRSLDCPHLLPGSAGATDAGHTGRHVNVGWSRGPSPGAMSVTSLIASGPLLFALPVAAAAGAVTFLSPCCLPLVPG